MAYSITWERKGVVWKYRGIVTGEELLRSNQEIYGDRRFDGLSYEIVDLSEVARFDVSPDDIVAIAANDRAAAITNPGVKVAVISRDPEVRRLSELYEKESSSSPWAHEIFDDEAGARAWLAARGDAD